MKYGHGAALDELCGNSLSAWAERRLESELSVTNEKLEDAMIPLGTVSYGTMREEDLIPAFILFLTEHTGTTARDILEEYDPVTRHIVGNWASGNDSPSMYSLITDDDQYDPVVTYEIGWLLSEDLFDRLQDIAPDGYYFGSHPGDGADYGFWQIDSEDLL